MQFARAALLLSLPLAAQIQIDAGRATIRSGSLTRVVEFNPTRLRTSSIAVDGGELLAGPAREFSVAVLREASKREPRRIKPGDSSESNDFSVGNRERWRGEHIVASRYVDTLPGAPKWIDQRLIELGLRPKLLSPPKAKLSANRLTLTATLDGLEIDLVYETYPGHSAIRKWVELRNTGDDWLRLDRMTIDDIQLAPLTRKPLAAAMFGVQPSVVAFERQDGRAGVIAASEVPSALRVIGDLGALAYSPELFEWVLGPGEKFTSEPVFHYAFSGPVRPTPSGASTPLDRTVEGPYLKFVSDVVGVEADRAPYHGPQYLTWAYFYDKIDDPLIRTLGDIVSRSGFKEMLLDDGWQRGRLGTEVDPQKFPDFASTSAFLRQKGLTLGLWVSCFRNLDSPDLRDMPGAATEPPLIRSQQLPGRAMSFSSPWRDYYVKDLAEVAKRYGVSYFKQDFTNIMYGDYAEGHESRTRRESILRGLRGLLSAQAALRKAAPHVVNEITHEIYWGTPGVPADLAALKHTARFHIPPNECIGSDIAREFAGRKIDAAEHRDALRRGCWLARQRLYSHRALPLYALEFYAAATTNHEGSLDAQTQDRQVASWLMGAPICYSGDARTLTDANIAHYRKRFDAIERLNKQYGIYRHFQFSGVPEPTDIDWHWWGKLNAAGEGAVVVVRGSAGAASRMVNVPWVERARRYQLSGLFTGTSYGVATGAALQDAGFAVALPAYGQDVIEVKLVKQ